MESSVAASTLFDALAARANLFYLGIALVAAGIVVWRVLAARALRKKEEEAWEKLSWAEKEKLKQEKFLR